MSKEKTVDADMTVGEAIDKLWKVIHRGSSCPCCGQFVRAYKRRLRGNHVRFLVDVMRKARPEQPWVHYSACSFAGRDYNYLRHFGLAEVKEREGLWKLTEKGARFVSAMIEIPDYLLIFNNEVVGSSEKTIDVRKALAAGGFDYDALMNE